MDKFIRMVIANPIAVILVIVLIFWGGTYALLNLPVSLFPGLDIPVVNVVSHNPGSSSADMELLITRPLENRIRTVPGVHRVSSTTIEGISQISVEFNWGTKLTDASQLVQAELSSVQSVLPKGVTPTIENIGTTLQEVAGYVIYGGGSTVEQRTIAQNDVASRLMSVEGVAGVEVMGGDEPAYIVKLHADAMAKNHLTLNNVSTALADYNQIAEADYLEQGAQEYYIRGDSRLQSEEDVLAVPVISNGSSSVFIKDIASVSSGYVPLHYEIQGNGTPAVSIVVSKQENASTINVVKGIDRELSNIKALLPEGAQIHKYYDQSEIISEAKNSLVLDLLVGALLAIAVLFFFMGSIRATLIVASTIPITLLATIALMQLFGQTFNVITLSALTLAVGMLVDDAIIVTENIVRHRQSQEDLMLASINGAVEIAGPDASGTFTTVAAFAPLLFVGSIVGLFIRPFGLIVSLALLVPLIVSLTFVPMLFAKTKNIILPQAPGSGLLKRIDKILQRVLVYSFAHRGRIVLFSFLLLGLGGLAAWLGPVSVLPPIDEGAILIEYIMPPGTSLHESNRIGTILDKIALAQPEVETVYRRTGSPELGFQIEGVNRGELTIKLAARNKRTHTVNQIMQKLRDAYSQIPGIVFMYHQPTQEKMDESLSGLPTVFGVTIYGTDTTELSAIAARVEEVMTHDSGLLNVINNNKNNSPQIIVKPNPVELARLGLAPSDVFETIQAARFGIPATIITGQKQQTQVIIKSNVPADATIDWLNDLIVSNSSGETVPLQQVAAISIAHLPSDITRLNGQLETTILAEVKGSLPKTIKRLTARFNTIKLPAGYSIAFTGQYQLMKKTTLDLALVGLAAILLIFLIMAMQFRSFIQPLIILVTIPIALVGAIVLLAITQVGIDVSVGMGALTLIGIAVNNAIVLLEYANRLIAQDKTVFEALQSAASIRLRPILMTAITTVFALIPVAVNPAIGSRIFQPFAIAVIGGLMSSTLATLIIVPTLRTLLPQK